MVEIFKTDVKSKRVAGKVLKELNQHLPAFSFNFDLDDCDRILRAQSKDCPVDCHTIIRIVEEHSVKISVWED